MIDGGRGHSQKLAERGDRHQAHRHVFGEVARVEGARGPDPGVARIGVDGIVEGSPGGIIRHVEPLPRGEALKAHRLADGDALGIHSLQNPRHRGGDALQVILKVAVRRFDARRVEHGHRGMKDRADVVHARLHHVIAGHELREGDAEATHDLWRAIGRQRRDGDAVLHPEDAHLSRVEHARGIDEGLRLGDDHISAHALLAENVSELQRAAGAPRVEHDDLAVGEEAGAALRHEAMPGRRRADHQDIRAGYRLFRIRSGRLHRRIPLWQVGQIRRHQLDTPGELDRHDPLRAPVEKPHREAHQPQVGSHRRAPMARAQDTEGRTLALLRSRRLWTWPAYTARASRGGPWPIQELRNASSEPSLLHGTMLLISRESGLAIWPPHPFTVAAAIPQPREHRLS